MITSIRVYIQISAKLGRKVDKGDFKVMFQKIMVEDVPDKKTPLKVRSVNKKKNSSSGNKKRKRKETTAKAKSKALTALSKLIRLGGIGPSVWRDLPEDPKKRAAELLQRVKAKGFEIEGSYPSQSEITAAKEARELQMSLDGIDKSNIIEGGRRRRRRVAVKRDKNFVDSSTIDEEEEEEESKHPSAASEEEEEDNNEVDVQSSSNNNTSVQKDEEEEESEFEFDDFDD